MLSSRRRQGTHGVGNELSSQDLTLKETVSFPVSFPLVSCPAPLVSTNSNEGIFMRHLDNNSGVSRRVADVIE